VCYFADAGRECPGERLAMAFLVGLQSGVWGGAREDEVAAIEQVGTDGRLCSLWKTGGRMRRHRERLRISDIEVSSRL
jgi:hypothetical protein